MRILLLLVLAWSSMLSAQTPAPAQAPPPKPFDCSAPEHRQFDFWIGEWDVVSSPAAGALAAPPPPAGRKPASNVITKAHDGCVLIENWTAGGQTGQSFNVYDRTSRRWHQTWVDNGGGLHQYGGSLEGGNMVFYGEVPLGSASRVAGRRFVRLTFFPMGPDKVRQLSESLNMDGTWSTGYDLIYTRKKPSS